MKDSLFHLAFPIHDVAAAKRFYVDGLGCTLGRESSHAVMFGLAGHQLVAHLTAEPRPPQRGIYPHHFGLVFLSRDSWQQCLEQARANRLTFFQQPRVRFPGTPLEHHTFFLEDPTGNLLEFKHYLHESAIFGEQACGEIGDASEYSTGES
jgi:uncharacterized protein